MTDAALIEDLVAANRILYSQGIVDGFGHVSVRVPGRNDRFLLARSMAPGLVTAADIMEFDLTGEAVDGRGRTTYLERFIHSEIYLAYPEVLSVVHSHSPAVIPFGITDEPLRPVYHMSSFLAAGAPVFEIREGAGDGTDMLIRDRKLGAALARKVGNSAVVLMRGHGNVVVGATLPQAVSRAIYTEMNARIQSEALRLGSGRVNYLSAGEAAAISLTHDKTMSRAWELWKREVLAEMR
ncbi:MAG TPA: class II aldolase/adducin family protein [Stellaceae bacterium]|nr:class II aldolase/adducin family protein [Stellaceae bacterium]